MEDTTATWGGYGWLILLFLFLFAFNGNGAIGNGAGTQNAMTDAETKVYSQLSANNAISNSKDIAVAGLQSQLATQQASYQDLLQFKDTQSKMDMCCCEIKSAVAADGQKTRDLINANKISELQNNNAVLRDALVTEQQTNALVSALRPYPTPSYVVSSPYTSLFGAGTGFGYYGY